MEKHCIFNVFRCDAELPFNLRADTGLSSDGYSFHVILLFLWQCLEMLDQFFQLFEHELVDIDNFLHSDALYSLRNGATRHWCTHDFCNCLLDKGITLMLVKQLIELHH